MLGPTHHVRNSGSNSSRGLDPIQSPTVVGVTANARSSFSTDPMQSPTMGRRHVRAELVRMSGDSGVGSGVLMLEWRSPGEEGVVSLGSAAGSCKEVGSGKSFYSGCCGLFVPDDLTAFMTHHAAAPLAMPAVLVVRRAPAGGGCRPYLCQVGRTVPCCRASRHACRTGGEVCACR
ncbi:hypothetical protein GW17_00056072, partial [Ensete ventricosum]